MSKDGLSLIARLLGNHTHREVFGVSKLTCIVPINEGDEVYEDGAVYTCCDQEEYVLPTAVGMYFIIYLTIILL